jgi:hypothetical protein
MNFIADKFVLKFGTCAIVAALFSGCATGTPSGLDGRAKMTRQQLNEFVYDCRIKDQQIAFLRSQYRSPDDMLTSIDGWLGNDQQSNWIIRFHIYELSTKCR